jgi:6-phosphogluconolactonase
LRLEGAEGPRFDLLELGMGDDGHTASLFPHTDALNEMIRIAVANHVPQKDAWRVTLTWPVIIAAHDVFFVIGGKDKADPLHRVFQGRYDPEMYPSQLIQPKNGKILLLLDKDAAAQLPPADEDGIGRLEIER